MIDRRPRAPVSRSWAFLAIARRALSVNSRSASSIANSCWYCLIRAFFGSVSTRISASSSSGVRALITGSRPTSSGIMPNSIRSSAFTCGSVSARPRSVCDFASWREADRPLAEPLADDVVEADERAAADEQDVRRVDLDVLLLGMLAAALRRHVGRRAFEHLQQGLLHAFAGDVAGDRDVLAGLADLVDLVDVEDAALGRLDVEVGGVQQLQQQVLDVFADVAGFGQRGGVADGERHVEDAGQRAGQQRLAAAGRADEQDVRLVDLDVRVVLGGHEPLVVVVHGDGEHVLGVLLADDVLVELRRRSRAARGCA